MKIISRRVPARTVRSYQCGVCGTKYRAAEKAKKCEARIKENKTFKKGDVVRGYERHVCSYMGEDREFQPEGRVIKVLGPMLPDYEYEVKWLDGRFERINGHVYLYEVAYKCLCGKPRKDLFRTPEIFLVKSRNR